MKTTKLFLTGIFALFLFTQVGAQVPDRDMVIPVDPKIKVGRLDNGMTYYIKQNKKPEQRIELRLAVNAGSICETDGQRGLAHFTEHMCFNGTKNFPGNTIIDMLEKIGVKFGAELNAYTSFDETVYMLKVPSDKTEWIDKGFQVLEDWAHQVTMDDNEIEKERGVIVEEWRLGLGAYERIRQKYFPVIFTGSKYADRLPIGNIDVIKTFSHDTLRSFYNKWYRPDLMAVVVVGDIDPALAESKVKEYFNRVPVSKDPMPRVYESIPDNKAPLISIVSDKEAGGYNVQIMFKHPAEKNVTYGNYRDYIMKGLISSMLSNRFQEIGQKPDAPFIYAGGNYSSFVGRTTDTYILMAGAKENQMDKAFEILLSENERVRRFGFTASELEREKKSMVTMYENMAKEVDKTDSRNYADEFVRNFLNQECIPGIMAELEIVNHFLPGIGLEEINKLAASFSGDENMLGLFLAKEKEGSRLITMSEVTDILEASKGKSLTAYSDNVSESPLLAKEPAGSKVAARSENPKFGYTELTFSNGVKMILKPTDFKNDEILISSFSPGGTSLYPDSSIMSAIYATSIVGQCGLGNFDMIGLQKKLAGNTARLNPYISELREGVNGRCSPKDLGTLLQLNYLYFTGIRKDETAFNTFISRTRNQYRPMRSVPMMIYQDTLVKIVNMNSPRIIAIPSEKQIDQINLNRALQIFSDRFSDASDFTYVMVGNFKTDEILPVLEKYIGGLPSTHRKEIWKDVSAKFPDDLVKVEVPRNSEPQSQVTMYWKSGFKYDDNSRLGFNMLMSILNIKCRESMREDQGGVYGVGLNGIPSRYPVERYTIVARWGCNPDNIGKLSQTVIDEMDRIRKSGPLEADLNKVKEILIRERESGVKENSFWLSSIQNFYQQGDGLQTLDEYKTSVNSMKIKDIKAIAGKYLNTKKYVQVSLTPAPKQN